MKESVRIIRFAIVGTLNALITALVVWLLMHIEGEDYITFLPVLSCWRIQHNSFFF